MEYTYEEFKDALIAELEDFYSSDAEIIIKEVLKTNGVRMEGLSIVHDKEEKVYPIIYIDEIYKKCVDEELPIKEVVGWVIDARERRNASESMLDVTKKLTDWDFAAENVYPALINTGYNAELLEELVSRPFLDLSIIYIIRIPTDGFEGSASTKVTKTMLANYRISEDELYEQAMFNLRNKDKAEFMSMGEALMALSGCSFELDDVPMKMYVLNNGSKEYGASQLLNIETVRKAHEGQAYYVIPSSIHEAILVEYDSEVDPQMIDSMIREINETELDARDILSDHVYFYDGKSDSIELCA